jgi:signal peptidase
VTGSPSIPRRLAKLVVWAIVGAGAFLTLVVAGPLALGDHPHTDLTGSMEPVISPGDVVMDEQIKPSEAQIGDIVTFRDPQNQSKLLTHRVVAMHRVGSKLAFATKGDANNTREHWQVPVDGQIARVIYWVPWIGQIAVFARTKLGWVILVGLPLLLLMGEELRRIWWPPADKEGAPDGVG